jgi:two-component system, response regulator / RNA-binding antiterminator
MNTNIPNFRNMTAFILHWQDNNFAALADQLRRLNITAIGQWPPVEQSEYRADMIFFDVDHGFDGMFPWHRSPPPMPLIAIVGSETPGRLEWAIDQRPSAYILKPVGSNGVFHSLVTAFHNHAQMKKTLETFAERQRRVDSRPLVVRTILTLMDKYRITDDQAFGLLRTASMRRRITIEDLSHKVMSGYQFDPEDFEACGSSTFSQIRPSTPLARSK